VKPSFAWLGNMKNGEPKERVFGLKMYPPNLKPDYEEQARVFIDGLIAEVFDQPADAPAATTTV